MMLTASRQRIRGSPPTARSSPRAWTPASRAARVQGRTFTALNGARPMKLMEYQGKDLFRRVGIPTPNGVFATTAADVAAYIAAHPGSWVLKSQVMMGGRGKAGGIKFADDAQQGEKLARELIGKILKSVQNPDGEEVKSLLVEEKVDIASEAYVSICLLYTSDAADDLLCVDLGGRRIIKKKKKQKTIT